MVEEEHREPESNGQEAETVVQELESLKKELEELKSKADANLAGWQRAQADFINLKRRTEQ